MAKLQSFSDFSTFRNTQAKIKLEEEKDTKRNVSAEAFKSMLSDFQVTSIKELDEDQRIEFFTKLKEAGINESVTLIEEGTRGQIGKIDKRGNITSVYMHYDSYPENVLPLIKKTYSKGGSPLNMILKNGDNSGLESDPSGMNYYGDFTASKGKISNVSKYLRDVADGGGAEFVYLWDEANKEWLMADIYGKGYDDVYPAFESLLVIEAISVQYKRDAKKVLTVYKNLFGKKLTDFGAMGKEDMLGCVKYLFEEAMTDANFHREKVISKNIKGRIGSFELKVPGLGNHFLKVGATTTKRILNKYYSDLANAAGWSGIGIVEGTALYLESIREEAMGQALLNAFNMFESKSNTGNLLNEARNKNILLNEASVVMDAMDPKSKTLKKLLKKYNVKMKILTMNGPGGGWPEVEMTGSREDLQSILADPNGWDDPELGEYIEESNDAFAVKVKAVNEAKFKIGEYIKAKTDSDDFDGDVYDITNDADGSPISKNASFEIYKIGKDEIVIWSDEDEVEYSIDPDDLKYFVKESIVTESDEPKCTNRKGHLYKQVDKDGTVECVHCGLRNSLSESLVTEDSLSGIEFGNDDDIHPTKFKPLVQSLKKNKVKMEVEKEEGSHGYPEVKLTGKRKDIEKVLADVWGPDSVSDYEDYFESVVTEAEVTSDEEFKEYAFTVLQKAFGDEFEEAKAQEVVDGLITKHSGDYGAMVGALTSSLGQ